jgi:HEAT repeat protein
LTPAYVNNQDVDNAVVREAWATVCKGLEMKDDRIRRHATEKLALHRPDNAQECICAHITAPDGGHDPAISAGLVGVKLDEYVSCLADLVKRPDLPRRTEAVVALAQTAAPITRKTLAEVARAAGETETRARAVAAIGGDPSYAADLMTLLDDPEPIMRAAAASGLGGNKDAKVVSALLAKAKGDEEGIVRAAALIAAKASNVRGADEMICAAMLDDPSPAVRIAAIGAFRGTRRNSAAACLRKRALTIEEDASVREKLLAVLKSSPNDNAALVLCDAIPFWMRSYVIDDIPDKIPGTMIVKVQNDRDWERSYDCFQKAYRNSGGYSCFAKMHVALWFREVGGSSYVPNCPGYENIEQGK